jgi:hypothetical protein
VEARQGGDRLLGVVAAEVGQGHAAPGGTCGNTPEHRLICDGRSRPVMRNQVGSNS